MKTAYDLLMSSPDKQVVRCKIAWKAVAEGRFEDAAFSLRNAANEESGDWARDAVELAEYLESKAS
jgi:hypothetical protein